MSREELEHSIAEIVNICACPDCSVPLMHKETLEVVERLLAQEREKVREMCAKLAESWNDTTDWMKARQRLPFRIAANIRQLDLTKLGEGGKEKGNG